MEDSADSTVKPKLGQEGQLEDEERLGKVARPMRRNYRTKVLGLLGPAVLGAVAGAGLQYYLQLAKPDVTLLDVTVPTVEQIKDSGRTVQISNKLKELTTKSENLPDLKGEVSISDLAKYAALIKTFQAETSDDIAWIDLWLPKIGASLSLEDKRNILLGFGDHKMIDGMVTGGLARSEERYAAPEPKELASHPTLFQYQQGKPGFRFYLLSANYTFRYRDV